MFRILSLALLGWLLAACQTYQFKGTEYPDPQPAPEFELVDTQGQPFRLSDRRGQVVLLFFGYTHCPDVCPITLGEARQIISDLGDDAGQVDFTFITVDPERDTPEVLDRYVSNFHPDIVGLSGDVDDLAAVRQAYGIFAEKEDLAHEHTHEDEAGDYLVGHTSRVFLVDPQGRLRLSYAFGTPAADITQDIRHLLK
ncbi:MAG: SCO family protein [Anaerolineae bacterium]